MIKNRTPLYNGMARRDDLADPQFVALSKEVLALDVAGVRNGGWDGHWSRSWEFPMMICSVLSFAKPGDTLMESGSGLTGVPFWLAEEGMHVTGVDLEAGLAKEWDKYKTAKGSTKFVVGDMLALPFPDNHFDCSYSVSAIEHTGNAPKAVSEMIRVTKPSGIVTLTMDIDISNSLGIPSAQFLRAQEILSEQTTPLVPSRVLTPSDILTFNTRTIKPQGKSYLGFKQFLASAGLYKWNDSCIFFYCGRKK